MRQLEFNLAPRAERDRAIAPWKYRFTKNALVEENDDKRIVYGVWESLFGCWIVDPVSGRSREIVPTWRPLNQNGIWRDQWDVRLSAESVHKSTLSPRWRYEANAAFAGYFAGIPQVARSLIASFEHLQWLGLDLISKDYQFAAFLDDELFNDREQFIFSCFTLSDATKQSRAWRHEFVTTLMTEKRAGLLGHLSGLSCSKATLRAIYKLGSSPCSKHVYQGLINFVNNHPLSKVFNHADQIPSGIINLLEKLPPELLQTNIVNIFLSDMDCDPGVAEIAEGRLGMYADKLAGLYSVAPKKLKIAMTDSFKRVRDDGQLIPYLDKWENRLIEIIEFPPSPVQTFENLIPLSGVAAMREESRQMQNCLVDMIPDVLHERAYFFHWDGPVPATVMIVNTPDQGWQFSEALGVKNEPVPEETEHGILCCFSTS